MDTILILFWAGTVVLALGFILLVSGGVSFQVRAIRNKPAWDGHTRTLLVWGIAIFIIGVVMSAPTIYLMYTAAA
ncbi:hypothetical protein [Bifidobacterium sp.]|jgi:flagellar biosynthesis protein FliR|uniref:hypothetical protein n=1 Tax=Bifidobacterium sp. TaxID=41200 RepID=UPI0025BDCFD7|nr:hypothetical protein [Bifidobacterium sp.]MCH4209151.1 hypothetical protein [Bifidobacterium sp.]